jgi:hypothetical protein
MSIDGGRRWWIELTSLADAENALRWKALVNDLDAANILMN